MGLNGNKKKVMLLSPDFGPGGSERSIAKLSVALAPLFDVHFVVFNKQIQQEYAIGGMLHSLEVPRGKTLLGKARRLLQRISKARRLKQRLDIDVTISFLEGADFVNILSAGRDKQILSVRGSKIFDQEISGWIGKLRLFLMRLLYRRASFIVAVSEGIRRELISPLGLESDRIGVIPNFYNFESIDDAAGQTTFNDAQQIFDRPVIVASGRLHIQKNYAGLLQVMSLLKGIGTSARLLILGSGPLKSSLLDICADLGLRAVDSPDLVRVDTDVVFLGYQQNPFPLIKKANLFVLTSLWEGFPNVLAEAMYLGVPVVACDCPHGPRDILGIPTSDVPTQEVIWTDSGVLVPLLNSRQAHATCAEALRKVLSDPVRARSMGISAQQRMLTFRQTSVVPKWIKVIEAPTNA